MKPSTLEPSFLTAAMLVTDYKNVAVTRAKAALLRAGLSQPTCCATDIPASVTQGDIHLAGVSVGALIAMKLLRGTGERIKSPVAEHKGRKIGIYCIPPERRNAAVAWLERNAPQQVAERQAEMFS